MVEMTEKTRRKGIQFIKSLERIIKMGSVKKEDVSYPVDEVLSMRKNGYYFKDIGIALNLSPATVHSIYKKEKALSTTAMAKEQNKLLQP